MIWSERELHSKRIKDGSKSLVFSYAPEKIPGLIESNDGELRNQAGETIAVLYEIAREINSIFAEPPEALLYTLEKKANESAKYKGKKEKRLQRATFREIYNSFEVKDRLDRRKQKNSPLLLGGYVPRVWH